MADPRYRRIPVQSRIPDPAFRPRTKVEPWPTWAYIAAPLAVMGGLPLLAIAGGVVLTGAGFLVIGAIALTWPRGLAVSPSDTKGEMEGRR